MPRDPQTTQRVLAGVVTGLVGFTSSFAVVLAGLTAMGADAEQAASGLAVLCVTMGMGCVLFALRYRTPITMAWSTPGAALLASSLTPAGGFPVAVGAFVLTGVLLALSGLLRPLTELVKRIPHSIANAMLAGVLLQLCIAPFVDMVSNPWTLGPVIVTWLVLLRIAPRWAVPGALATAIVVMGLTGTFAQVSASDLVPRVTWTTPTLDWQAVVSVAIPLYIVTMTSQNIPGIAVLASFGYPPPIRAALTYTGAATVAGAPFGGHAINLSAIAAALSAGPEAGADRSRRWVAALVAGITYASFGPISRAVTSVSQAAPPGLLAGIAGLALVSSFAAAAAGAMGETSHRQEAAIAFLVAASGITIAGIGSAFWGLVAGLLAVAVLRRKAPTSEA